MVAVVHRREWALKDKRLVEPAGLRHTMMRISGATNRPSAWRRWLRLSARRSA